MTKYNHCTHLLSTLVFVFLFLFAFFGRFFSVWKKSVFVLSENVKEEEEKSDKTVQSVIHASKIYLCLKLYSVRQMRVCIWGNKMKFCCLLSEFRNWQKAKGSRKRVKRNGSEDGWTISLWERKQNVAKHSKKKVQAKSTRIRLKCVHVYVCVCLCE